MRIKDPEIKRINDKVQVAVQRIREATANISRDELDTISGYYGDRLFRYWTIDETPPPQECKDAIRSAIEWAHWLREVKLLD